MAEFLEDPSVLTKDKLKNELAANNVALPSGEHKKEVYVQLYLKNLTAQNNKRSPPADAFSSDDELPAPVVLSNKSRSGRKATKKTDKPRVEVEVTDLTDEDLKMQLAKYGVDAGPIVASSRKLYEKKLQKLLEEPTAEAPADVTALPEADADQNGNTNSDQYSDKEAEEISSTEPEPVPVAEKPVRSRGKTPVGVRTATRRQTKVVDGEEGGAAAAAAAADGPPVKAGESVVEDILANEISTPTGISATRRRPIRGAAGRPLKPADYWLDESRVRRSVRTENRSYSESYSRGVGAAPCPSAGKAPARGGALSLPLKLAAVLAAVCGSLYLAYRHLDGAHRSDLRGLLDAVAAPLRGAAAYLGLGGK